MKHIIPMMIFVVLALMSCSKYLDKKPDSSVTVPTTLADLQAILDFTNNMNLQTTPGFGESSADDYFLLEPDYDFYTVEAQKIYTWNRGDYYFQNSWSRAYTPVFNANFCLDQLNKIPATNGNMLQWNNVKGSALFYRSYYFWICCGTLQKRTILFLTTQIWVLCSGSHPILMYHLKDQQ